MPRREETNKAKSTCGGKKLQLCLYMMYPDYLVYPVKVATLLLRMVASIYKPFSVKAFGVLTFPPFFEVENFDFNKSHSFLLSSTIYP